jgi:hypothetical protein
VDRYLFQYNNTILRRVETDILLITFLLYFFCTLTHKKSQDTSVDTAMGYGLNDRGFDSRPGQEIFLYSTEFEQDLEPTQSPIQWATEGGGVFPQTQSGWAVKLN